MGGSGERSSCLVDERITPAPQDGRRRPSPGLIRGWPIWFIVEVTVGEYLFIDAGF